MCRDALMAVSGARAILPRFSVRRMFISALALALAPHTIYLPSENDLKKVTKVNWPINFLPIFRVFFHIHIEMMHFNGFIE